jgi:cation diffusion facilitator family transporter
MGSDLRTVAMRASLVAAVLMLGGKLVAYFITGSTALLSDAAESVIHIFATGVAGFSLWYARQPASRHHPYGHGKIAYFSAGFEGALILTAALFIIWTGIAALIRGPQLRHLDWGLLITAVLTSINLGLGLFLIHVGRTRNALILVANGKHVLTDMWTSLGVIVGVGIVWLTGIVWIDPAVAIAVGANILFSAVGLMRRSFRGLLDEARPEHTAQILESLERAAGEGVISGFHQLRHRASNDVLWIELHILMPGEMAMAEAHRRVTQVEETVRGLFPNYSVRVTTHIEPVGHEIDHPEGHPGLEDPFETVAQAMREERVR